MIALSIFVVVAMLQLCFALPSTVWWACVILVVLAGLTRIAVSGVVLPTVPFMIWCLIYLLYRLAAFSWSVDTSATISDILHTLCLMSFFFAALQLLSNDNANKYLGLVAVGISSAIFIFLAYLFAVYALKYGYVSGKDFKYLMYIKRGLHVHMIIYAFGIMVILSLLSISEKLTDSKMLIYSFLALLVPMIFVFTLGARNVLLMQVVFCGILVVIHCFNKFRWTIAIGMSAAVIILVAFVALGDGLLSKRLREESTHRDELWTKSYQAAMESPLTGFGYGTVGKVLGQTTKAEQVGVSSDFGGGSHNIFFNALVEGGWVGLVLVMVFFIIIVLDSGSIGVSIPCNILLSLIVGLWARGFVEVGGLFGAGNGVGDYLSWLCIAAYYACRPKRTKVATGPLLGAQNAS